ncbi:transcriptional regulator [Rhizobium sp. Rhizsp82]|uniref:transcriptional regulator n=1 Tax=Rhizobium sp. Rhizsp82 TaxID=3243057 RepID=UPI0039B440AA
MRKQQRQFVVEVKSSRRRTSAAIPSIWGNIDLKAAARDLDNDLSGTVEIPTTTDAPDGRAAQRIGDALETLDKNELLTVENQQTKTSVSTGESIPMADEINPDSAPESAVAEQVSPPKKKRAPRARKADAIVAPASSEPTKKNRGGRPKRAEASALSATAAVAPKGRGKRAASASPAAAKRGQYRISKGASQISPLADDLADLLQLEEENKRLRQSLAEKLRAENANLRNRLGLK